jgi:hypothetical protein
MWFLQLHAGSNFVRHPGFGPTVLMNQECLEIWGDISEVFHTAPSTRWFSSAAAAAQRRRSDLRGRRASGDAFRAGEIRYATGPPPTMLVGLEFKPFGARR